MLGLFNKKKGKTGLVGVSCNDLELSLAHVSYESGQPELLLCECEPISSWKQAGKVLGDKVRKYGLEQALCNFVLSPDDYNLLLVEAPAVETAELAAAAKWKIKDMVDRPLEQLAISVFRVPREAYKSQRDMLYVVAADRKKVQQAVDMILESGLQLSSIDIPELAMLNLLDLYADDSNGLAMIDLRNNGSMLNLSRNKALYLTRHLNTQIGEEDMNAAEWESVRERLILEIQRSLDYYESQMGQAHINRLLLTPRDRNGELLVEQLKNAMGLQVEVMNLQNTFGGTEELAVDVQQSCMLAIGAALRTEEAA